MRNQEGKKNSKEKMNQNHFSNYKIVGKLGSFIFFLLTYLKSSKC